MKQYEFRWNDWNLDHIETHGLTPDEAEYVIRAARSPYPRRIEFGKYLVRGQTGAGEYVQIVFIEDPIEMTYVIHARPLTEREKRLYRRGKR